MSSIDRTGPAKRFRRINGRSMLLLLTAAALVPAVSLPATAAPGDYSASRDRFDPGLRDALRQRVDTGLRPFYAERSYRPLWIDANGDIAPAADRLLDLIESAQFDGIQTRRLRSRDLLRTLDRAADGGRPDDLAKAEIALSRAFAAYVMAMRGVSGSAMIYESQALAPVLPTAAAALQAAGEAPSLTGYLERMGWMHPLYAPVRNAMLDDAWNEDERSQMWATLARLRAIPANPAGRYVLIDAAGARLWMYENGAPVDSMRVIVGKPDQQTPMMAGFIRYAVVNPYWNVPEDLVRANIAPNVLGKGADYLRGGGYELLDDWGETPGRVDPASVDWNAVASGARELRVRQLPGKTNFMGRVKFMFPNNLGIYLHDTPDKALMLKDQRQLSSGCVRLENAARLGRWLLQRPLPARVKTPEHRVDLTAPVPVYITYLPALAERGRIAFSGDPYGHDTSRQFAGGAIGGDREDLRTIASVRRGAQ